MAGQSEILPWSAYEIAQLDSLFDRIKAPKIVTGSPDEKAYTCLCRRPKSIFELESFWDPVLNSNVLSDICKGCRDGERVKNATCTLVCINCRRVIARMYPEKTKYGFEFKPGRTYHVSNCPGCVGDNPHAFIVEKHLYDRNRLRENLPIESMEGILYEQERLTKQAEKNHHANQETEAH